MNSSEDHLSPQDLSAAKPDEPSSPPPVEKDLAKIEEDRITEEMNKAVEGVRRSYRENPHLQVPY